MHILDIHIKKPFIKKHVFIDMCSIRRSYFPGIFLFEFYDWKYEHTIKISGFYDAWEITKKHVFWDAFRIFIIHQLFIQKYEKIYFQYIFNLSFHAFVEIYWKHIFLYFWLDWWFMENKKSKGVSKKHDFLNAKIINGLSKPNDIYRKNFNTILDCTKFGRDGWYWCWSLSRPIAWVNPKWSRRIWLTSGPGGKQGHISRILF